MKRYLWLLVAVANFGASGNSSVAFGQSHQIADCSIPFIVYSDYNPSDNGIHCLGTEGPLSLGIGADSFEAKLSPNADFMAYMTVKDPSRLVNNTYLLHIYNLLTSQESVIMESSGFITHRWIRPTNWLLIGIWDKFPRGSPREPDKYLRYDAPTSSLRELNWPQGEFIGYVEPQSTFILRNHTGLFGIPQNGTGAPYPIELAHEVWFYSVDISPDGQQVIYTVDCEDGKDGCFAVFELESHETTIIDPFYVPWSGIRDLSAPKISDSGRYVAFRFAGDGLLIYDLQERHLNYIDQLDRVITSSWVHDTDIFVVLLCMPPMAQCQNQNLYSVQYSIDLQWSIVTQLSHTFTPKHLASNALE